MSNIRYTPTPECIYHSQIWPKTARKGPTIKGSFESRYACSSARLPSKVWSRRQRAARPFNNFKNNILFAIFYKSYLSQSVNLSWLHTERHTGTLFFLYQSAMASFARDSSAEGGRSSTMNSPTPCRKKKDLVA